MRTIDFFEHLVHSLDVIMIQEPCLAIFLVFLEGDTERVCDIDCFAIVLAKQDTDNTLS